MTRTTRRILKILALLAAVGLIVLVAGVANEMVGNPISKHLAVNTAERYLAETHPGTDYTIDRVVYSFKDTGYHCFVVSPSSADTRFTVVVDQWGRLYYETYDTVASKWNTARRLEEEYRALTDTVFDSSIFPYASDIAFGTLSIVSREAIDNPRVTDIPDYALVQDELELDQVYDIRALGAAAGRLVVYVDETDITAVRAAEIMLDIKAKMDEAGIPFRAMDFHLQPPLPEEGPRTGKRIDVSDFPAADIYADGLADRIAAAAAKE